MRERHARKRLLTMAALAAVLIAAGAAAAAYGLTGHDGSYSRPSGIPASIPDSQVNLMELSPVPVRQPAMSLTYCYRQLLLLARRIRGLGLASGRRHAPADPNPAAGGWR